MFVSEPNSHYCGRVFFLWRRLFSVTSQKLQTLLTLSSNNSRSETPNPDNSHIFGIVRTSAFSWCYPYRVYDIRMLSNCGKYKKIHFFAFLGVRSQKNSTGRRSDNIDASGLPNSSSESWRPEDSENVGVFEIWRFWTGVMVAQSQVIKKSVHKNWCFQA